MTNSMHNEDNNNGVPITVTLPFRKEDKTIVVQKQAFKVLGDANYWTPGNEAKDRLVGFWRYVDKEMLSYVTPTELIPTWEQANDDQTCPLFVADNEYSYDAKGDFKDVDVPVRIRLNFKPQQCGLEDFSSQLMFSTASDVTSIKLKNKCCYYTVYDKAHCSFLPKAVITRGKHTKVTQSNTDGNDVFESEDELDNEGDSTFVSRYWVEVMQNIREWKRADRKQAV